MSKSTRIAGKQREPIAKLNRDSSVQLVAVSVGGNEMKSAVPFFRSATDASAGAPLHKLNRGGPVAFYWDVPAAAANHNRQLQ